MELCSEVVLSLDKEARAVHEEAVEHIVTDIVYVASKRDESGADGINFGTTGATGDPDCLGTVRATKILKEKYPDMYIELAVAGECILSMDGKTTYESLRLARLYPHDQIRLASRFSGRLGQRQKVKLYVKDQKMREEMVDPFGQKQILITGPGKGQTFILYPETKTYIAIPPATALSPVGQDEEALKKIGTRRLIGQEDVSGYLCDKYEIVFHDRYRGKMILWVAGKLNYPIRMAQVDGPPVGALNRELTNIKEGGVNDSLFKVPGDYRIIKKPVKGFCGAAVCPVSFY